MRSTPLAVLALLADALAALGLLRILGLGPSVPNLPDGARLLVATGVSAAVGLALAFLAFAASRSAPKRWGKRSAEARRGAFVSTLALVAAVGALGTLGWLIRATA